MRTVAVRALYGGGLELRWRQPADEKHGAETVRLIIRADWDYPHIAEILELVPDKRCTCGRSDGTVSCTECGVTAEEMIGSAWEAIEPWLGKKKKVLCAYYRLDEYFAMGYCQTLLTKAEFDADYPVSDWDRKRGTTSYYDPDDHRAWID